MVQVFDQSIRRRGMRIFLSLRPAWFIEQVPGQTGYTERTPILKLPPPPKFLKNAFACFPVDIMGHGTLRRLRGLFLGVGSLYAMSSWGRTQVGRFMLLCIETSLVLVDCFYDKGGLELNIMCHLQSVGVTGIPTHPK